MTKTLALLPCVMAIIVAATLHVSCGEGARAKEKPVALINWKAADCDNTYDPYRLVNRITESKTQGGITYLTVNFRESCCATSGFKPQIEFKNDTLFLLSYTGASPDSCACDCCFSIEFAIEGLPASGYQTFFHGKKIEVSNDHYKVVKPTSETYKGETINRTNRYGFKEGLWMTFYKEGSVGTIEMYPESELYYDESPVWQKHFYPSGKLSYFSRNDTTESWFEDGTIKTQTTEYKVGDTTYQKVFELHKNRRLHKKSLERSYLVPYHSDFDPQATTTSKTDTLYNEEYFENGQIKFRFGKDTICTWHANGRIASLEFNNEKIDYDEAGLVTERAFYWHIRGQHQWPALHHALYAEISRKGKVLKIEYVRDEARQDGVVPSMRYQWAWNEAEKLVEAPADWNEPLPWAKFKQLIIR